MGLAMMVDKEEDVCGRGGGEENSLVESLRMTYADSIGDELRHFEINFVISDPRLPENPIVYASEGFCKMSGYCREEVVGRNCRFLQGPDTDRRTVLEVRDAIREERSAQVRILNYTKEGKPFWNLFHLAPVFSKADGSVIHFVGVQTPISCQLATSLQENESIVSQQEVNRLNGFSNGFANSSMNSHRVVIPSSGMDMDVYRKRAKRAVTTCARSRGMGVSDAFKPQELECLKAATATRTIVSQLVESSKGKGEVLHRRDLQCTAAGVVSSSLMLSLTRIQQSFVLADPQLADAPIVHASDLFLHLTGYNREDVLGRNCRFLQGPGTDPAAIAQIRESISLEKPCSVRLLNYRKDQRAFWNLLHVSPVRNSEGKVAFFVGVQLQVSAADKEEDESTGMSAHMKQLGAVGAVRVAVRSLQGAGLRRTITKCQR